MSEEQKKPAAEEEAAPLQQLPDLKALREARGLTIEEIFLKTRISSDTLKAIEAGAYELLPAPLYARKFIEIYAGSIGVDPGLILGRYQRYLDQKQAETANTPPPLPPVPADRSSLKRSLGLLLAAAAVAAAAIILYGLWHRQPSDPTVQQVPPSAPSPAPTAKEQPRPAAETIPPTPTPTPTPAPAAAPAVPQASPPPPAAVPAQKATATPAKGPLDLLIEARQDTWLQITEDRKPPYQTTLRAGQRLSRRAGESFLIDVGNAAGVTITFQGTPLPPLGRTGQVVHLRLPQQ